MQNQETQKLFETITKSQKILVALPKVPTTDAIGSALAFASFIKKLGKDVDIVSEQKDFGTLSFLPGIESIKNNIEFPKTFIISVNTSKTKIDELSYHTNKDKVDIHLKPKSGFFNKEDISFGDGFTGYDFIICLDTPSLEQLGDLYARNAETFFNVPKANIDNHINNENYANINLVDVTASSTAEILLEILKNYEESFIDSNIATNLLTGIISSTNSFQHASTTPNSFLRASQLIAYGAKQQEIVRNLFKRRELSILKLWGRAMARMKQLNQGIVFSAVTKQDLEKSEASIEDLPKVVKEFVSNVADIKLLFLVAEHGSGVEMYVYAGPNIKLQEIVNHISGKMISEHIGHVYLENTALGSMESKTLAIFNELKQRLGL